MSPENVRSLLLLPTAIVVLIGWCAALVDALLSKEYTLITAVTPVMLILVGFLCGTGIVRRVLRDDQ